jgi:HAE1 family hydrophobic/amphiphilic exporter-1
MAFRSGQSAEVWNQLGTTVAVGLLVSTMVTLILVPTMYSLFEQGKKKSG